MALPASVQFKYWGLAAIVFALILWALGDVLMPFILGGAIAYFLDPLADRLERAGLSRMGATTVITVFALLLFIVISLAVIPSLVSQTAGLFETLPAAFRHLTEYIRDNLPSLLDADNPIRRALMGIGETLRAKGGQMLDAVLTSAASLFNLITLFLIVPVVAVYMLLDWDRMIAQIDSLLPRDHLDTIRTLARDIDRTIAAFVRGMGTVCLILGTFYSISLMLVGLQFGLVVGVVAGLVTFIPYLGALIGGALAIGLALFQFWGDWVSIGLVAGIFVMGQTLEGNFLTPRLVGNSVGLHPVWLLLALSVFGALFGFVGMLVAVPVAASIGVVARFLTGKYTDSRLYQGIGYQKKD